MKINQNTKMRQFKLFTIVLLFNILFCIEPINAQVKYEVSSQAQINVRSLPGLDTWILGTIAPKEQIIVYGIKDGWAEIKFNNQTAYINAKGIRKVQVSNKKGNYKVISQNNLKVRSTPSTEGQILGNLQPSELIEVISINNKWAKIKYKSSTGYVHTDYIKKL